MTDAVQIALIVSAGPTVIGILNFISGRIDRRQSQRDHEETRNSVGNMGKTVATIEKNTNDMLSKLKSERDEARSQADTLAGRQAGVESEQDRVKP